MRRTPSQGDGQPQVVTSSLHFTGSNPEFRGGGGGGGDLDVPHDGDHIEVTSLKGGYAPHVQIRLLKSKRHTIVQKQ